VPEPVRCPGCALGDAVYGTTNELFAGGYAEYALVQTGRVAGKPAALDYVTAAGLPVVAVTAWQMLFEYARIEPGQAILVRGAAGSVGACATQMAKESRASVYGTLLRAVVELGCSRAQNSLVDEPDVLCDGVAPNVQFVGWEIMVGIANGQTAYDHQLGRNIQLSSDNVRITCY